MAFILIYGIAAGIIAVVTIDATNPGVFLGGWTPFNHDPIANDKESFVLWFTLTLSMALFGPRLAEACGL